MWCKTSSILISFIAIATSGGFALAVCPSADLTGDCFVDFNDFALLAIDWPATDYNNIAEMANQWLTPDPYVPDDMAYIPGGTFEMGDTFNEGWSGELPVHTVTVDSFYMGEHEITNRQYCDYLNSALAQSLIAVSSGVIYKSGAGTSYPYCDTHSAHSDSQIDYSSGGFSVRTKSGRDMSNDPMVQVSWYGAAAYCNWRSQKGECEACYDPCDPNWLCDFSKKGYRLATEAEWEYAARGGLPGMRFPWDDTISHSQANYYSRWDAGSPYFPYDVSPTEGYHPTWNDGVHPYTSPVGGFPPNGYDLYDMASNVAQWCNDWFQSSYATGRPNPNWNQIARVSGSYGILRGGSYRVIRGASWGDNAWNCRVAARCGSGPDWRSHGLGFRVVLLK